jgi:DNA-binding transcriptional ArsR family regulator
MSYESQFAAYAHPLRQRIIERLSVSPAHVRELTEILDVSQPVVSQHLKVLKDCGLVTAEARGARNIHRLEPEQLDQLRKHLERHWRACLEGLGQNEPDD